MHAASPALCVRATLRCEWCEYVIPACSGVNGARGRDTYTRASL